MATASTNCRERTSRIAPNDTPPSPPKPSRRYRQGLTVSTAESSPGLIAGARLDFGVVGRGLWRLHPYATRPDQQIGVPLRCSSSTAPPEQVAIAMAEGARHRKAPSYRATSPSLGSLARGGLGRQACRSSTSPWRA